MNTTQILAEIREANLGYLMLAQSLLRADRQPALEILGLHGRAADRLVGLTASELSRLASGNTLLSRFSMEDDVVFDLIMQHAKPAANGSALRQAA